MQLLTNWCRGRSCGGIYELTMQTQARVQLAQHLRSEEDGREKVVYMTSLKVHKIGYCADEWGRSITYHVSYHVTIP